MRHIVVCLGVLLISVSHAFAADSSFDMDTYCRTTSPSQVCDEYKAILQKQAGIDAELAAYKRFKAEDAENHPVINLCFTTKDPGGCIETFRTTQPDAYALELARMEQQLALEEARYKFLQEQIEFERRYQAERQQEGHLAR